MEETITIGIDLAKVNFQLYGLKGGKEVSKSHCRLLKSDHVLEYFKSQPRSIVAMEACATSHYWGRCLQALGHEVRLIAPQNVKPLRLGQKNDANDAAAIAYAATRPEMRFVPIKSEAEQDQTALINSRENLVELITRLKNSMRARLSEFGFSAHQGKGGFKYLVSIIEQGHDENGVIVPTNSLFALKLDLQHLQLLVQNLDDIEANINSQAKANQEIKNLMTIPGVGVIIATMLVAYGGDVSRFKSSRYFAAWLGLVPRQHSSGGKYRLSHITKQGNRSARRCLYLGGLAIVAMAVRESGKEEASAEWGELLKFAQRLLAAGKPRKVVAVALARKIAQIAWVLMTKGETYRTAPVCAAA